MQRLSILYFIVFSLVCFIQCKDRRTGDDVLLAKVYEQELYQSELMQNLEEDNIDENAKSQYVDSWIRQQLLLKNAKLDNGEKEEIEDLVESYRESLIIQKHKEKIVSKKLNRDISEEELLKVYNSMKSAYKLKSSIFRTEIVVTPADHFDKLDLKNFFNTGKMDEWKSSLENLVDLHIQDTSKWYTWTEINQFIPSDLLSEDNTKSEEDYFRENEEHLFFIRIFEKVNKNELAPLSYMKEKIERAILENRKQELLKNYSTELYNSALKNNQIKLSQE